MKRVKPLVLLESIIVIGLVMSIGAYHVASVSGTSATSTYVLGVSSPMDPLVIDLQSLSSSVTILPGVSSLSLVGGNSILFVDGSWLASISSLDPTVLSLIQQKLLSGVPTVAIRGTPSLLDDSLSKLVKARLPNLPLIANGVSVTGTLPDGTINGSTLEVIAGFDYAVNAEYTWAQRQLSQASSSTILASPQVSLKTSRGLSASTTTSTTTGPFWQFQGTVTVDTGDQFAPMGRVVSTFLLYSLQNDGTDSYKWFNLFANQTIQPGIAIYGSTYGSTFRNAEQADRIFSNNSTSNTLVDHGPRLFQAISPSIVNYTMGITNSVSGAVVSANQTESYSLSHTTVSDFSSNHDVVIVHDVDSKTTAGKQSLQIIPGFTTRVDQTAYLDINGAFTTSFVQFSGNSANTQSTTLSFRIFGG